MTRCNTHAAPIPPSHVFLKPLVFFLKHGCDLHEAKYFIALRDSCWILCFEALANPPEIPPTPAEFADSIVTKAFAQVSNKNN